MPLNFQWHYTRMKKTWCINKVHFVKRKPHFLNLNRESISRLYLTPWRWHDKITNEFAECASINFWCLVPVFGHCCKKCIFSANQLLTKHSNNIIAISTPVFNKVSVFGSCKLLNWKVFQGALSSLYDWCKCYENMLKFFAVQGLPKLEKLQLPWSS